MLVQVSLIGKVFYCQIRYWSSNPAYIKNQLVPWVEDKKQLSWNECHKLKLYRFYQNLKPHLPSNLQSYIYNQEGQREKFPVLPKTI